MTHLTADDTPNIEETGASHPTDTPRELLSALREQLLARCNTEEELKTLCADLGVNYDDLPAQGREAKARELVAWLDRHDRIADLQAMLARPLPITTPAIDDYLTALRDYCANLPYLTLNDIRPPKTLDEVYVPLKARPLPREDEKPEPDEERARRELERSGPLSIAEVMRQHDPPHVLILGEPGAGKSTLLRQLAEHAWDAPDKIGLDAPYLPILVPLRRLATAEGALEERLNHALTAELTLKQALPPGFFTNWPKQTGANWLILLDALDEVPADQRPQLMQWLKGLLNRIGQNCIVITSRPSGYSQGELDDKLFGHYDLLSFTPDQTGEFARRWFGDGKPCEGSEPSQGSAEQFLKELERVRAGALSGTPLLLTVAAKVYLEKGTLPERRSGLYGQFVDIWLGEAEQRGMRPELGDAVCDVANFALARLALAMTEQPTQTETSLKKVAVDYLREAVPLTEERARIAAESFLKVVVRRSGVFTSRGYTYDFIHPTFREYLAACAVVQENKHRSGYNLEQVWRKAVARWADKNWREVALFVLNLLSDNEQDVTALVSRIWRKSKEGLYFAGAALAEQAKVSESVSDGIIDGLFTRASRRSSERSISILGELRSHPRAGDRLLITARDEKVYEPVRLRAAAALGLWVERADEAASILLAFARNERMNWWLREDAAQALGRLGRANEAAQAWLALACDEKVGVWMRLSAAEALGLRLRQAEEAVPILLALAYDERVSVWVHVGAAEALGKLGQVDKAMHILLALARNEKVDAWVRERAAEALDRLEHIRQRTERNHDDTQTPLPRQD